MWSLKFVILKSWNSRSFRVGDAEPYDLAEMKTAQVTESNLSSEEEEEEYEEPTTHYTALLQTLQATNETFAKAYAPRYLLDLNLVKFGFRRSFWLVVFTFLDFVHFAAF